MKNRKAIQEYIKSQKKKILLPSLIALIGALLLVVTIIVPFASATEDFEEYLEYLDDRDIEYGRELGMTNEEQIDLSLVEYAVGYARLAEQGWSEGIIYVCVIAIFCLFILLTTLCTSLKKPIGIIIFDILSLGMFLLIQWDFDERGVVPGYHYDLGTAQYFCYLGFAVAMAGAIYLIVTKHNLKKEFLRSSKAPYCMGYEMLPRIEQSENKPQKQPVRVENVGVKHCTACGTKAVDAAKFCPNCGSRFY